MSTPLTVKLRQSALANSGITALLGTAPFRWYNMQLTEGSAYPAVTAMQVSKVPYYVAAGRGQISLCRVQLTIWSGNVPNDTDSVIDALRTWLSTLDLTGSPNPGYQRNYVVNERDGMFVQTQPAVYMTMLDVMVWNNDTL